MWNAFSIVDLLCVIVIVTSWSIYAGGTCNNDQYHSCRNAALKGDLQSLEGGGYCLAKPYIQFTHLCMVNNYTPNIDYCCCIIQQQEQQEQHHQRQHHQQQQQQNELRLAACCRYHQDWNYFRCTEVDDVVDITTPSAKTLNVEWMAAAILFPTIVALVCLYCVIKCCCYRYDDESQTLCSHYFKTSWKNSPSKTLRGDVACSEEEGEDEQLSLSLTFEHSSYYGRHFWRSRSSRCASYERPPPSGWRSSEEWHLMRYVPSTLGPGREYVLEPSVTYPDPLAYSDYANYHPINSSVYLAGKTGLRCCPHTPRHRGFYGHLVAPPTANAPYDRFFYSQTAGVCGSVTSSRVPCSDMTSLRHPYNEMTSSRVTCSDMTSLRHLRSDDEHSRACCKYCGHPPMLCPRAPSFLSPLCTTSGLAPSGGGISVQPCGRGGGWPLEQPVEEVGDRLAWLQDSNAIRTVEGQALGSGSEGGKLQETARDEEKEQREMEALEARKDREMEGQRNA